MTITFLGFLKFTRNFRTYFSNSLAMMTMIFCFILAQLQTPNVTLIMLTLDQTVIV